MMESYHLYEDVPQEKLRSYMMGYFTMMMAICSVFTKLSDKPGIDASSPPCGATCAPTTRRCTARPVTA